MTCDKADLHTEMIFRSPSLVIEVLSPSTQSYDRSQKFALYRRLDSLQEYVLIDPETRRVESFRKDEKSQWVLHDMSDSALLTVASPSLEIPLSQIFEGLDVKADWVGIGVGQIPARILHAESRHVEASA